MLGYTPNNFAGGINYNSPTVQNMMYNTPNNFAGGINYNSPTVQNMMYNTQYSNTPNFGNIGGYGYNNYNYINTPYYDNNQMMNGGYYSGYYGGYNPQEVMRQMEMQRKAQEQMLRNQIEIQKLKARIYNTYNGIETDEEYLEQLYNPNTYAEIQKDLDEYDEMVRLSAVSNDPANQVGPNYNAINYFNNLSEKYREQHPVDQSFTDFMNTAGDLYCEAMINDSVREMKRNIANTYDKDAYHQLAMMHNQSFTSLRQAVSVDDLSISLPPSLQRSQSYQERKNQFLNYIMEDPRNRNRGGT